MDVFRHNDIAVNSHTETSADALQGVFESSSGVLSSKELSAVIAGEGYEMALLCILVAFKAPRHEGRLCRAKTPLKQKEGLSGAPMPIWDCDFDHIHV